MEHRFGFGGCCVVGVVVVGIRDIAVVGVVWIVGDGGVSTRIGTWGTRIGIVVWYRIFFFLVVCVGVGFVVVRVGEVVDDGSGVVCQVILAAVGFFLPCLESLPVFNLLGVKYFFELFWLLFAMGS